MCRFFLTKTGTGIPVRIFDNETGSIHHFYNHRKKEKLRLNKFDWYKCICAILFKANEIVIVVYGDSDKDP